MQPDRLIVGECRGDETAILLQSLYNGQRGVLTTMYAQSVRDSLKRLETLCAFGEKHMTVELLHTYIAHTFDVLLFLKRFPDGTRKLTNIVELLSEEKGVGKIQSIFYYQEATVKQTKGTFETSGFHSPLLTKIRSRL